MPVHLFGELIQTSAGADLIARKGFVKEYQQALFAQETTMNEKRSILWTLAHIGAHENGIKLIHETSLIKDIVELAENSPVLSLRGTCIYIVGMMCRTRAGRRVVQKHNWLFS